MTRRALAMALAIGVAAVPALAAAEAPAACTAPVAPTGVWAAWRGATPLSAGHDLAGAPVLRVGQAIRLTLMPSAHLAFAATPGRQADAAGFGGLAKLRVARAGIYRIGLSGAAWIDVVAAGKPLASTAHGHGPACSGIRKIVDFSLRPGDYVVQLAASPEPAVTIMVVGR